MELYFSLSVLVLAVTWIWASMLGVIKYKSKRILTQDKILFAGTFLSAAVMFYPVYVKNFEIAGTLDFLKPILASVQNAIRLFALDGDYFDTLVGFEFYPSDEMKQNYTLLGAVLYVCAPLLTFGFILSFFKNLKSHRRYIFNFYKTTHVFSELNKKSLALAKNIMEYDKKTRKFKLFPTAMVVFTDVLKKQEEESIELIEAAKELGAVLFTKDLEAVRYRFKKSVRKVNFYLISDDETEKISHAENIMKNYDYKNTVLRVFSYSIASELLLASKNVKNMKVIRVNDIQSLIYNNLDKYGARLFETAREREDGKKVISAAIVGLGRYGIELLKALSWYCQLDGYTVKINVFDNSPTAMEEFVDMCPDLMSEKYNGRDNNGDAEYDITIHQGIDVYSDEFIQKMLAIKDLTYIFICLGDDETNLKNAVRIRSLCERNMKYKPDIETVVYDSDIKNNMNCNPGVSDMGVHNFKKQPYNIHMIGDLENFYSVETIIESELITEGIGVHMRYANDDEEFWKYEYNYRSSIAKALHERLRRKLGLDIPGVCKPWDERTEEEKLAIGKVEHRRWNAYMRSEGYRYSGSKDKSTRNDLAKLHHNLVPVTELTDDDLRKDA